MGDLGALQFVQNFDFERWSDKDVMAVIENSNVIYNVIGSNRRKWKFEKNDWVDTFMF